MDIVHDAANSRFEARLEGQACVTEYLLREHAHEVVFTHTYVPPPLRGRGVAGGLVKTALEWARERHLRVVPACAYVRGYLQRHPELQDLRERAA